MGKRPEAKYYITAEDRSGRTVSSAERRLKALTGTAKALTGAFAGAISVRALMRLTSETISYGSAITDVSDKLGIGVDKLQEWRYAAQENGISTNAADMGLQRFIRRVAEAAQGTGELKGILDQYNISVKDSTGASRDIWEVMGDLSDAIQGVNDDGERLRIAFKAFDSEGAALVSVLRDGSNGYNQLAASARLSGQIMTNETARALDVVSDAIERAKTQVKNFWAETLVRGASIFSDNPYIDLAAEVEKYIDAQTKLDKLIEASGKKWNENSVTIRRAYKSPTGLNEAIAAQKETLDQYQKNIDDFRAKAEEKEKKLRGMFKDLGLFDEDGSDGEVATQEYTKALSSAQVAQERFMRAQMSSAEEASYLSGQIKTLSVELSSLASNEMQNSVEYQEKLAELYGLKLELYSLDEKSRKDSLNAFDQWVSANLSDQELLINAMKRTSDSMADAFAEFCETGELNFSNFVSSILADMAKMTFQQEVANPFTQWLSSGISGLLGSGGGGAEGAGVSRAAAEGGPVYAGRSYLVGEGGRTEVFTPSVNGNIISNDEVGGSANTFNISISAVDARGVDRLLTERKQMFVGFLNEALNRRGQKGV